MHSPSHHQKNRKGAGYQYCKPGSRLCGRIYKGMVIVWLLLALTSLFAASEIGQTMTAYINDSVMLKYLYENNPVIKLIENIL